MIDTKNEIDENLEINKNDLLLVVGGILLLIFIIIVIYCDHDAVSGFGFLLLWLFYCFRFTIIDFIHDVLVKFILHIFYKKQIKEIIKLLKKHFPPGYLYTDHIKWYSTRPDYLRIYLKRVNAVMRMDDKYIIPVIMHTSDQRYAGYTYNDIGSWIYINIDLNKPGYEYPCFYTLLHEYMHHFLRCHNLTINDNTFLNELLTDCAVVYFGFEEVFKQGRKKGDIIYGYIRNDDQFEILQKIVKQERFFNRKKMKKYWTTFTF